MNDLPHKINHMKVGKLYTTNLLQFRCANLANKMTKAIDKIIFMIIFMFKK